MNLLNVKQAAQFLKVTQCRVRVLCRAGRIDGAVKLGRDWFTPESPVVKKANRIRPGKIPMV